VRVGSSVSARARRLVRPAHDPSYAATLGAWVDATAGGPLDTPSLQDGLRSLEIVAAAASAAASGERIHL
jgi:predicted dehydrogenase